MIIEPASGFSSTDPRSDVWALLPIPPSERQRCRAGASAASVAQTSSAACAVADSANLVLLAKQPAAAAIEQRLRPPHVG
jgi:hypothetical protein